MSEETRIELQGQFGYQCVRIQPSQGLGVGSYGNVCRAMLDELPCAAKLLHPTFFGTNDPGAANFAVRFEQECQFLSNLRHPCIVQFLGLVREPHNLRPILLMELMDESLTRFLERVVGPLPYHVQVNLTHDTAQALAYLHSNSIIHRDLSSNNVLILAGSRAKVTDFGMSRMIGINPRMTPLTQCPGTQVYMAPEALLADPIYSDKLDVFSAGVLTVQILTRRFPMPSKPKRKEEFHASPTGFIEVPVPERERRSSDLSRVTSTHPLLPIALECIKDRDRDRPTAAQLCQSLAALKEAQAYADSVEESREDSASDYVVREIQELREQLEQNEAQLQETVQQLAEKEDTLRANQRHMRSKEKQVTTLEHQHVLLEGAVRRKDKELQSLRREVDDMEQLLADFQVNLLDKEREIEMFKQKRLEEITKDKAFVSGASPHDYSREASKQHVEGEEDKDKAKPSGFGWFVDRIKHVFQTQTSTPAQPSSTPLDAEMVQPKLRTPAVPYNSPHSGEDMFKPRSTIRQTLASMENSKPSQSPPVSPSQHNEPTIVAMPSDTSSDEVMVEDEPTSRQQAPPPVEKSEPLQLPRLTPSQETETPSPVGMSEPLTLPRLSPSQETETPSPVRVSEPLQLPQLSPSQKTETTPPKTVTKPFCLPQKVKSVFKWKTRSGAPDTMRRGTAVAHGNVAYFNYATVVVHGYNIDTDKWTQLPDCDRMFFGFAVINDLLTAVGGKKGNESTNSLASLYHGEWVEFVPPMPTERCDPSVVVTSDLKHTIVAGGSKDLGVVWLSTIEILNNSALQWTTACDMPTPMKGIAATICNRNVYFFNWGHSVYSCTMNSLLSSCQPQLADVQLNRTSSVTWSALPDVPALWSTPATLCGELIAVGGEGVSTIHLYNTANGSWEVIGHMPTVKRSSLVVVLPGAKWKILVVGGFVTKSLNTVELGTIC